MGYEGLNRLCDPSVLGIINQFETAPDLKRLSEVLIEIYGAPQLLANKTKRDIILEYLDSSTAKRLLGNFSSSETSDPWGALRKVKFNKEKLNLLFEFFSVEASDLVKESDSSILFCEEIYSEYSLFSHQENAAQKIKIFLKDKKSKVLLHMPTGSGKTRTAMSIACDYIRNNLAIRQDSLVVWLADTEELCEQAASEFSRAWKNLGVGSAQLYRLYGNVQPDFDKITSGFVVIGLQKLNSISVRNQQQFYKICQRTSLVIFDEAHKAIATTYRASVSVFQAIGNARLLGLSATPGRSTFNESENNEFAEFFNRNKVTLEVDGYSSPVDYLIDNGFIARANYHEISYDSSELLITLSKLFKDNDEEPSAELLKELGRDQKRNLSILNLCLDLISEKRKIILFAPSVENAQALYTLLRYRSVSAGIVTSKTEDSLRRKYIELYKNGDIDILINYGVLTTGFDAPITNVAIIARPTNSLTLFSQMVGRAVRGKNAGGNETADIYIVKDTLPGLRELANAFSHWDDAWS
jgi:superfamily II DNA or RNA helicase